MDYDSEARERERERQEQQERLARLEGIVNADQKAAMERIEKNLKARRAAVLKRAKARDAASLEAERAAAEQHNEEMKRRFEGDDEDTIYNPVPGGISPPANTRAEHQSRPYDPDKDFALYEKSEDRSRNVKKLSAEEADKGSFVHRPLKPKQDLRKLATAQAAPPEDRALPRGWHSTKPASKKAGKKKQLSKADIRNIERAMFVAQDAKGFPPPPPKPRDTTRAAMRIY